MTDPFAIEPIYLRQEKLDAFTHAVALCEWVLNSIHSIRFLR